MLSYFNFQDISRFSNTITYGIFFILSGADHRKYASIVFDAMFESFTRKFTLILVNVSVTVHDIRCHHFIKISISKDAF